MWRNKLFVCWHSIKVPRVDEYACALRKKHKILLGMSLGRKREIFCVTLAFCLLFDYLTSFPILTNGLFMQITYTLQPLRNLGGSGEYVRLWLWKTCLFLSPYSVVKQLQVFFPRIQSNCYKIFSTKTMHYIHFANNSSLKNTCI